MPVRNPFGLPADVIMPEIWCPLVPRTHPDLLTADAYVAGWLRRWGVFTNLGDRAAPFVAAGFGRFTAYAYPDSHDLELATGWMVWAWYVDDCLDDPAGSFADRVGWVREIPQQLSAEPEPAATGFVTAAELWRRTAARMSPSWRERIRSHLRDYLSLTLRKPSCGGPSSVTAATYCRRRRHHSGVDFSLDLIEAVHGYEVPDIVAGSDLYRAVRGAANDAISWTNDLYSLPKEAARGEHEHLVGMLLAGQACSYQQAVDRAAVMIRTATEDFLAGADDVRAARCLFDNVSGEQWANVERSLRDIGSFIAGSLAWHVESDRY